MSNRITVNHLRKAVERLNIAAGMPTKAWKKDESGNSVSIPGCYVLSGAYGGWQLQKIDNEHGGVVNITDGHRPAREVYHAIYCYLRGLRDGLNNS